MATRRRYYPPTESDIPLHGWSPYSDIHRERIRAHAKHDTGGASMERLPFDATSAWLAVVMEEVGEVARVVCEVRHDGDGTPAWTPERRAELRGELVQTAAMVCAWVEAIDFGPDGR
jgi:hypothetical protein